MKPSGAMFKFLEALFCVAVTACGAKTGLLAPCRADLRPVPREVVLLLDDSGTTSGQAVDSGSMSDWQVLLTGTRTALFALDDRILLGASYFPVGGPNSCRVADRIGVEPGVRHLDPVMQFLGSAPETGNTPMGPGIGVVDAYVRSRPHDASPFVILATDGIANCNESIACDVCNCGVPGHACCFPGNGGGCLDDVEVRARVHALRDAGALLAVIALPLGDVANPAVYQDFLDSVASIGGLENAEGPRRYYPGNDSAQIAASLRSILATVDTCRFTLPEGALLPTGSPLIMEGRTVPLVHDPMQVDGWEWVDSSQARIELFGSTCSEYRERHPRISVLTRTAICR